MSFEGNWEQVSGENREKILEALGKLLFLSYVDY